MSCTPNGLVPPLVQHLEHAHRSARPTSWARTGCCAGCTRPSAQRRRRTGRPRSRWRQPAADRSRPRTRRAPPRWGWSCSAPGHVRPPRATSKRSSSRSSSTRNSAAASASRHRRGHLDDSAQLFLLAGGRRGYDARRGRQLEHGADLRRKGVIALLRVQPRDLAVLFFKGPGCVGEARREVVDGIHRVAVIRWGQGAREEKLFGKERRAGMGRRGLPARRVVTRVYVGGWQKSVASGPSLGEEERRIQPVFEHRRPKDWAAQQLFG